MTEKNQAIADAYKLLAKTLCELDRLGEEVQLDEVGSLIGNSGRVDWAAGSNWLARTAALEEL